MKPNILKKRSLKENSVKESLVKESLVKENLVKESSVKESSVKNSLIKQIKFCVCMTSVASLIFSCSRIDELPKSNISMPEKWQYQETNSELATNLDAEWWNLFRSVQLQKLIESARDKNSDVKIALERAKQAELQMRIANASLFPSINFSASSGERNSKLPLDTWKGSGSTAASFNASYEIDLWGEQYANRLYAKNNYHSIRFAQAATRLSIEAAVAAAWFNFIALEERISTTEKNIEIAVRIQNIVKAQYKNGFASAGDLATQTTNLLNLQNSLLPLQLQRDQTRAAIAVLVAQAPQNFVLATESIDQIDIPKIYPGVPSSLLTRRPDVASSEAQLRAASANIYVARTAFLPAVDVSGSVGKTGATLFSLNPATQTSAWSLGLVQTIFAGGRVKNQLAISESKQIELLESYRKVVLTALQETDDALERTQLYELQEKNQQQIFSQAELSLKLVEVGYKEGGKDLSSLLDAQRTLFQSRDALVQVRYLRLKSVVDLYKALGGGWSPQKPE